MATTSTTVHASWLNYDIPESCNYPNPSAKLWEVGCTRFQLSCWLVPMAVRGRPEFMNLLAEMAAGGVQKIRLIRVHEDEEAQIREMARDALSMEAERVHTSLIRKIDAADQAFKSALAAEEASHDNELAVWYGLAPARKKRLGRIRAAIRNAGKQLNSAITAAEAFDETMNVADAIQGLKATIKARQLAFQAELESALVG